MSTRNVRAEGISRFHFWGDYYQTFVLEFASAEDAAEALSVLQQLPAPANQGWKQHENMLGNFTEHVAEVEAALVGFGADPTKISSLAKSVDVGEPFEVTIPVPVPDHTMLLPLEGGEGKDV